MADNNPGREKAKAKARTLQHDVTLIMEVERDEEALLAKLQGIADGYHELANLWEAAGDAQMVDQARQEEERTRALMARLSELAGLTAAEAEQVLEEVKASLRAAATQAASA